MGSAEIEALKVSVKYTSDDWNALSKDNSDDWIKAANIVSDRLHGRYLSYSTECLKSPHSGFVVLSIDCLIMETIQQFREGIIENQGRGRSQELISSFLSGQYFQPEFNPIAIDSFFKDIRCGLLHQAEARNKWLIRRKQDSILREFPGGDGYIIDIEIFHEALCNTFEEYLNDIVVKENFGLRDNLWKKMNDISNVRAQRGAVFGQI